MPLPPLPPAAVLPLVTRASPGGLAPMLRARPTRAAWRAEGVPLKQFVEKVVTDQAEPCSGLRNASNTGNTGTDRCSRLA